MYRSYPQTSPYRSYTPSTDCAQNCRNVGNFGILFPFPYLLSSGDVSLAVARRVGLDSEVTLVTHHFLGPTGRLLAERADCLGQVCKEALPGGQNLPGSPQFAHPHGDLVFLFFARGQDVGFFFLEACRDLVVLQPVPWICGRDQDVAIARMWPLPASGRFQDDAVCRMQPVPGCLSFQHSASAMMWQAPGCGRRQDAAGPRMWQIPGCV